MADSDSGLFGLVGAALMLPAPVVVAAEYLTIDAAQRAVFPDADSFVPVVLAATSEQRRVMAARAGPQPRHGALRAWRAERAGEPVGYVFVDEVIGKSDFITYATGIAPNGDLRAVEIMAYRESHGAEIRNAAWRAQFANRNGLAQLRFREDIRNIAGATLSSEHVTQGVRWLVAVWEILLKDAAPQP